MTPAEFDVAANLWILDALVTHGTPRDGRTPLTAADVREFAAFRKIYYLSDGGYSRVLVNDDIQAQLVDSTPRSLERWESAAVVTQRRRLETSVRHLLQNWPVS